MATTTRLFERFDESTHTYFSDGSPVPSVTGCLDGAGLSDFSGIPPAIIERKQKIGKYVHAATHYVDENDIVWESIDPVCMPYVRAYEKFKLDTGFHPIVAERQGVAVINGMKVGFTLDRFGKWCGLPFLIDLKCGAEEGMSWKAQLAGYELCLPFCDLEGAFLPPLMGCGRAAVMLKPDGNYKVFRYDANRGSLRSPVEARQDFDAFRSSLFIETWKRSQR